MGVDCLEQSRRNIYLDLLRGLAAIAVMLYHYTVRYQELFGHVSIYPLNFSYGCTAIELFFIVSGYFAVSHMEKTNASTYAVKRFFRMYPSYWVAILITFPLVTALLPSRSVSLTDALVNLTMTQGFFAIASVDGAYWTLQYELFFYFLVGVLILLKLDKHIEKMCIAWVVVMILFLFLPKILIFNYARKVFSMFFIGNGYGHMFIAGGILALLEKRLFVEKNVVILVLLFCSLFGCIILQFHLFGITYGVLFSMYIVLMGHGIMLYRRNIRIPEKLMRVFRPFCFIASISYPLYLIHQNIGYIIIQVMEQTGWTSEIFILIPISLMIGLAYLIHQFIEKPCVKASNKICMSIMMG